jgi:hypothetical protein
MELAAVIQRAGWIAELGLAIAPASRKSGPQRFSANPAPMNISD